MSLWGRGGGGVHSRGLSTGLLVPQVTCGGSGAGVGFCLAVPGASVLLRVTVLQADLQPDRLQNPPALPPVRDFPHRLAQGVPGDFAAHGSRTAKTRKELLLLF